MNGKIIVVSELKASRQPGGDPYYLVIFDIDGVGAKSFICPTYRNFPAWQPVLHVGTEVTGLTMRSQGVVDADSPVKKKSLDNHIKP